MAESKWDRLVDEYVSTQPNANTRKGYRYRLNAFRQWCERNDVDPLEATSDQVNTFLVRHLVDEKKVKGTTESVYRFALRGFYAFAEKKGVVKSPPLVVATLPGFVRWRSQAPEVVSTDTVRHMLAAAQQNDARDRAVLRLLTVCALRPEEVEALDVPDAAQASATEPRLRVGMRWVVLDNETARAVSELAEGRTHGPLILNQAGNRLRRSNTRDILRRVAKQAEVDEPVTARKLRSTAIALALAEGSRLEDLGDAIGQRGLQSYALAADRYRPSIPPVMLTAAALAPEGDEADVLLLQARRLALDEGIHPAAAIVLAAGILERTLRELAVQEGVPLHKDENKITIESLAGPLVGKKVISAKVKKQIDALADRRNDAAHGRFDRVEKGDAIEVVNGVQKLLSGLQKKLRAK